MDMGKQRIYKHTPSRASDGSGHRRWVTEWRSKANPRSARCEARAQI